MKKFLIIIKEFSAMEKIIVISFLLIFLITINTSNAQLNVPHGWKDDGGTNPIYPVANDYSVDKQICIGTNTANANTSLTIVGSQTITGNLNATGTMTANSFVGNGSGLTNLPTASVSWGNVTGTPTDNSLVSTSPATNKIPYTTSNNLNNWVTVFTRSGANIAPGTITDSVSVGTTTQRNSSVVTIVGSGSSPLTVELGTFGVGTNTTATMTGSSTPSGIVEASGNAVTFEPWRAFDRILDASSRWIASTDTTSWLRYDFGTGTTKYIKSYNIAPSEPTYAPKTWTFEGSLDNNSWTILDTQTNITGWSALTYKSFTGIGMTGNYRSFRINITASQGNGNTDISELQLIEVTKIQTPLFITLDGGVVMGSSTSANTGFLQEIIGDSYLSGKQVIGTTTAASMYGTSTIIGGDNNVVQTLTIPVAQASITAADVFQEYRSNAGVEGSVAGTGVPGVLAFNTFTWTHRTIIEDRIGLQIFDVLETTGEPLNLWIRNEKMLKTIDVEDLDINGNPILIAIGQREGSGTVWTKKTHKEDKIVTESKEIKGMSAKSQLVKSKICTTRQSRKAWGIYAGTDSIGVDYVMAGGTAKARIYNLGKNVKQGDYFMSSDFKGGVELQADDLLHNYTLGKSLEDVTWEPGEQYREIACTLHGG